jgi:hypothetical protein
VLPAAIEPLTPTCHHQPHALVGDAPEGFDREVRPLEVVRAVQRGDKGPDDRIGGNAELASSGCAVPGPEGRHIDAVRNDDDVRAELSVARAEVRNGHRVLGGQRANAVGAPRERSSPGLLPHPEQRTALALADQAVLVADHEPRYPLAKPRQKYQLRPEDEGMLYVDDVEPVQPRELGDQWRVADAEQWSAAMDDCCARRPRAVRRRGEDLHVMPAAREAVRLVEAGGTGPSKVWGEGRGDVRDSECHGSG